MISLLKKYHPLASAVSLACAALTPLAVAAPGALSDLPLTFVVAPQPNILIVMDDSGSMTRRQVIRNEAQAVLGIDAEGTASSLVDGTLGVFFDGVNSDIAVRELCRGVNSLAYNPSVKYEPWLGKNNNGDEYRDREVSGTNGLLGNTFNNSLASGLSAFSGANFFYVDWRDKGPSGTGDADGIYQDGECGGPIANYEAGKEPGHVFDLDPDDNQVTSLPYGVLYDDGGVLFNYSGKDATFAISVPATSGDLEFSLIFANFDGGNDGPSNGGDELSIYQGNDSSGSPIRTLNGEFSSDPARLVNNTHYSLETTFTVPGSEAFLVFKGDGDEHKRDGFKLTWRHTGASSVTNVESTVIDNMVTGEDCTGHCVLVSTLPATEADVAPDAEYPYNTQQNYANWYSYYRSRAYVATKALSNVVDASEARLGFATINNKWGARIESMNVPANKDALFRALFASTVNPSGSTPLLSALLNAGRYFHADQLPDTDFFGESFNPTAVVSNSHLASDFTATTNTPILNSGRGGQCQQNFTLVFSDGAYSDTITGIGNADGDGVLDDNTTRSEFDQDLYGDQYSNTMADIAMTYFENDLSSSLDNALRLSINDQIITHQHMSTYTVGFGVSGGLSEVPTSYELDSSGEPKVDSSGDNIIVGEWPKAEVHQPSALDDMRHAAFNGRGEFFSAFEPQQLISDLNDVISSIADRVDNTGTGAAFSSFELSSESQLFKVIYSSESWWGDLQSFNFDDDLDEFESTYEWSADERMTERSARATTRQIITYNGREGIPFRFPQHFTDLVEVTDTAGGTVSPATLNSAQVDDLTRYVELTATEAETQTYGENIVSYLRGDDTHDGTLFRDRFDHYLGAFVHSQPQHVGMPGRPYPDNIETSLYSSFVTANKYRRPLVYASGNDGMLHGFYASSTYETAGGPVTDTDSGGTEVFAYIPGLVSDANNGGNGLSEMAQASYTNKPYVDGTATVSDVFVDTDNDGARDTWKTYLVSGLRGGSKGIYVVDVTDPALLLDAEGADALGNSHADQIAVMEFTHDDLGFVYGRPQVAKMNNGRWAAIVPNGYNNYPEGNGTSKLFIIYIDGYDDPAYSGGVVDGQVDYDILEASEHSWTACAAENASCTLSSAAYVRYGVNGEYVYQDMPAGEFTCDNTTFGDSVTSGDVKSCDYSDVDANGLSTPTVIDTNNDLIADKIYAGDLHGNLWVFNVSADLSSDWGVDDSDLTDSVRTPLFTACGTALVGGKCAASDRQAITSRPAVLSHPLQDNAVTDPNTLVFFGTGQYVSEIDKADTKQQSFYGVWDAGHAHRGLDRTAGFVEQDISLINTTQSRGLSDNPVPYAADAGSANIYGWYMDFPNSSPGERVVIRPVVVSDIILFATLIPEDGLCSISAGSSYLMAAKLINGGAPSVDVFNEGNDPNHGYTAGQFIGGIIVGIESTASKNGVSVRADKSDGTSETTDTISDSGLGAGRKSWSILR